MMGFLGNRKSEKEDIRERYLKEAEMAREYDYARRQQGVLNEHQNNQARRSQQQET